MSKRFRRLFLEARINSYIKIKKLWAKIGKFLELKEKISWLSLHKTSLETLKNLTLKISNPSELEKFWRMIAIKKLNPALK